MQFIVKDNYKENVLDFSCEIQNCFHIVIICHRTILLHKEGSAFIMYISYWLEIISPAYVIIIIISILWTHFLSIHEADEKCQEMQTMYITVYILILKLPLIYWGGT